MQLLTHSLFPSLRGETVFLTYSSRKPLSIQICNIIYNFKERITRELISPQFLFLFSLLLHILFLLVSFLFVCLSFCQYLFFSSFFIFPNCFTSIDCWSLLLGYLDSNFELNIKSQVRRRSLNLTFLI